MEKYGIGILGCGERMKAIVSLLFSVDTKCKLISVYDPDIEAAENFVNKFGGVICNNYLEVIKNPEIKWVFIGSPNNAHKEQIVASFNEGKNVFSEKPLAVSVSDCMEIKKVYDEKKPLFLISYSLRYSRHYKKIKEIIDSGKIGDLVSFEFNEVLDFNHGSYIMTGWRRFEEISGGHILEKCCHDMDIANWFIGSLPKKVASFGGLNFFKSENKYIFEETKAHGLNLNPFLSDKSIIDNQVAIIEYRNGVRAMFHTNLSSGIPERRIYMCGTKGAIRADVLTGKIEFKSINPKENMIEIIDEESKGGHGGGDKYLVEELKKTISEGKGPEATMEDAIKSAVTAIEVDRAGKEERIIDLEPTWKKFGF